MGKDNKTDTALDAELHELWGRRRDLDEPEWTRLIQIVMNVLLKFRPRELASLPEERDVYIWEFIQDKVYRIDLLSRCDHAGALHVYFKRYLLDVIRSKQSRSKWEVADKHDPDSESPPSLNEAPARDSDDKDPYIELQEAGIAPPDVAASAIAWLAGSEDWVRLSVALSNCPDAELSEPLVRLAKRMGIKSQAHRAKQLGFNWHEDHPKPFAETMIGRWIVSLGIAILPENKPLILGALNILCWEALSWVEQQETAP